MSQQGFLGVSDGKEYAWIAGDLGLIPGSGRSSGRGKSNQVFLCVEFHGQMSLLGTVHGAAKSQTRLSD